MVKEGRWHQIPKDLLIFLLCVKRLHDVMPFRIFRSKGILEVTQKTQWWLWSYRSKNISRFLRLNQLIHPQQKGWLESRHQKWVNHTKLNCCNHMKSLLKVDFCFTKFYCQGMKSTHNTLKLNITIQCLSFMWWKSSVTFALWSYLSRS